MAWGSKGNRRISPGHVVIQLVAYVGSVGVAAEIRKYFEPALTLALALLTYVNVNNIYILERGVT
jgi:hypothetical protein